MLCDDLEGWDGGERKEFQEGGDICILIVDSHCRTAETNNIVMQLCVCLCVCVCVCAHAQSCLTLCDPMACSPPGSSVHGILQTRILEWVAISFSRGSS